MPWDAIKYVSSGVTLVAFLASLVAWIYKSNVDQRERLIRSASEADRATLIQDALEFFHVDTGNLNKEQRYDIVIRQITERSKRLRNNSFLIFGLSIVAAVVTIIIMMSSTKSSADPVPRFDLKIKDVKFFKVGDGQKAEVDLSFFPTEQFQNAFSTIFTGIVIVDDEAKITNATKFDQSKTCAQSPYCIEARTFNQYNSAPLYVRGSNNEAEVETIFDIPAGVRAIRVYAEFYQREATGNNRCVFDASKPFPEDGIPYLKVIDQHGNYAGNICFNATTRRIIPVPK